jgi:hypothetical protein
VTDGGRSGDDEEHGRLVPLYILVGGRTTPRRTDLDLATQVVAAPAEPTALEPEYEEIVTACVEWVSIAEIAAHLGRPLTVVKILVDILLEQGYLAVGAAAQRTIVNRPLLQTLLDGLQRL